MNDIEKKLDDYTKLLKKAHDLWDFSYTKGRKYYRIVMKSRCQTGVFCFVDKEGNLYKAACWESPAKGIRGHISQPIVKWGGFYK